MTSGSLPSAHQPPRGNRAQDQTDLRREYRHIWGEDPPAPARLPGDGLDGDEGISWPSGPRERGELLKSRLSGLYRALNGFGRERRTDLPQIVREVLAQIDRLDELLTELQEELRRERRGT